MMEWKNNAGDVSGKYATKNWDGKININGCSVQPPDYYGYCGETSMDGYRFRLNFRL